MTRHVIAALVILAACEGPRPRPPVYWTPPDAGGDEPQAPYCLRRFEDNATIGACTYRDRVWNCTPCSICTDADGGGEICYR